MLLNNMKLDLMLEQIFNHPRSQLSKVSINLHNHRFNKENNYKLDRQIYSLIETVPKIYIVKFETTK
jgi:hypothetical protein